jgi:hypothetical protein
MWIGIAAYNFFKFPHFRGVHANNCEFYHIALNRADSIVNILMQLHTKFVTMTIIAVTLVFAGVAAAMLTVQPAKAVSPAPCDSRTRSDISR